MLDKDDQKREHSGLGMKMLLSGMAESRKSKDGEGGPVVVKRITPQLLDGVDGAESPHIKSELLDALHTCLLRFGAACAETAELAAKGHVTRALFSSTHIGTPQ